MTDAVSAISAGLVSAWVFAFANEKSRITNQKSRIGNEFILGAGGILTGAVAVGIGWMNYNANQKSKWQDRISGSSNVIAQNKPGRVP